MISFVKFENFKCFKSFELKDLSQITLISGKNNVGKTALLDGIYFANRINKPNTIIELHNTRNVSLNKLTPENLWGDFFYSRNMSAPCKISEIFDDKKIDIKFVSEKNKKSSNFQIKNVDRIADPLNYEFLIAEIYAENFKAKVITSIIGDSSINQNISGNLEFSQYPNIVYLDTHRNHNLNIIEDFGKIDIAGELGNVIDSLKIFEPTIQSVSVVVSGRESQIFAKTKCFSQKVPLKSMGDGINRFFEMIVTIIANPNSIILIDEIENGFHYSLHKDLWKIIAKAAVLAKSQLVITTHSYECISAAVETVNDEKFQNNFKYIRIDRESDTFFPKYYDAKLLGSATMQEIEVR